VSAGGHTFDAVGLELAVGTLHSLAEEMGVALVRSARSANIKERRDSSTAVFDGDGRPAVQAEHIPVHLGALPASVAAVVSRQQAPGDVWILNHPYAGGTHLPDITMVAPVHLGGRLCAYVACRAHHADIGGAQPGSMPAGARSLFEEGLILPPLRLEKAGIEQEDLLELILANCRRPEERRGDLRAQAAACRLGTRRLAEVEASRGDGYVEAALKAVRDYSVRRARAALTRLPEGTYRGEDALEGDGLTEEPVPIRACVTIGADRLVVDLSESAAQVPGNLNCPRAVTVSACLFVARCLLDPGPLGAAGCMEVVEVRTRPGSVVDALPPAAVAGGNVETSQRVVDTILSALGDPLGLPAASQGTMNNVVLGSDTFSYYETLAGGAGASAEGPGTDAIHSAMTNTLNTPIEAIERDFPLRVLRYELREGSGGAGRHRGGRGLIRTLLLLQPATLNLLAERQHHGAPGRLGGGAGASGRCLVNGEVVPGKASFHLETGDVVTVETPGGGGWGEEVPPI
jgi:N-methylhydantoinase B